MDGRHDEGIHPCRRALALYGEAGDNIGISNALSSIGMAAWNLGDVELARTSTDAAYRHARIAGDDALIGRALAKTANMASPANGNHVLEQAAVLLTKAGDHRGLASIHFDAAYVALIEDRTAEAIRLLDIAVPAAERADSPVVTMLLLGNLGLAHLFSDDLERARDAFEQQLRLCRGRSFRHGPDEGLAGLAAVSARDGRPDHAAPFGQEHAPAVAHAGDRFQRDGGGPVLALRRHFASAARGRSALPPAVESSRSGVRRSRRRCCPERIARSLARDGVGMAGSAD
jgi:hypothetical protein